MRLLVLLSAVVMACVGCAHTQQPERRIYVIAEDTQGVGTALGTGGAGDRDCQEEHEACFRRCWRKSYPPYPHKHDEWYYKRCTADCRKAFNECVDEQEEAEREAKKLEFRGVDQAIEWIRINKAEVALGTIIIIAGAAFVITTGGSGALILAPLAL
ncbi:hypothetical protein [Archangium gephyra]|uniref:hypothetical protein n=1 Tax=Archangium gephyra TaxID=48 RepID=UPI0011C1996C|nr:hypothetical protein [Archangium gephyra]